MKHVCLLVDVSGRFVGEGDRDVAQALRDQGVQVQWACWQTSDVAFHAFDAVVVRTCYGYHHDLTAFLVWMREAQRRGTRFVNSAEVVTWNADKAYLWDLQQAGVSTVPTQFVDAGEGLELSAILARHQWDEAVVKPMVSAGSENTWRINRQSAAASQDRFAALSAQRGMMVQPFLRQVQSDGEISLVYLDGKLSHCVRKVPKAGDFRVQPEHGGTLVDVTPPDASLAVAEKCLDVVAHLFAGDAPTKRPPVYGRVDGVMTPDGYLLMELELIEPDLYLTGRSQPTQTYVNALMAQL